MKGNILSLGLVIALGASAMAQNVKTTDFHALEEGELTTYFNALTGLSDMDNCSLLDSFYYKDANGEHLLYIISHRPANDALREDILYYREYQYLTDKVGKLNWQYSEGPLPAPRNIQQRTDFIQSTDLDNDDKLELFFVNQSYDLLKSNAMTNQKTAMLFVSNGKTYNIQGTMKAIGDSSKGETKLNFGKGTEGLSPFVKSYITKIWTEASEENSSNGFRYAYKPVQTIASGLSVWMVDDLSYDGSAWTYALSDASGKWFKTPQTEVETNYGIAISPDAQWLYNMTIDGIYVSNFKDDKVEQIFSGNSFLEYMNGLLISPDGKHIIFIYKEDEGNNNAVISILPLDGNKEITASPINKRVNLVYRTIETSMFPSLIEFKDNNTLQYYTRNESGSIQDMLLKIEE